MRIRWPGGHRQTSVNTRDNTPVPTAVMKSMVVLALVAVLAPAALAKPSGWPLGGVLGLGHGGLVAAPHAVAVAAPVAVSHSSLVQTHSSPVVVAAPAVHGAVLAAPAVHGAVLAAPGLHGLHGLHGGPGLIAAGPHGTVVAGPAGLISESHGHVGAIAVGHGLHHW